MSLTAQQIAQYKAAGKSDADIANIDKTSANSTPVSNPLGELAKGYGTAKGLGLFGGGSDAASSGAFPVASGVNGGTILSDGTLAPAEGLGSVPFAVPVAAAAGTYLAGKSINDSLHGKVDNSTQGKAGRAQAAFSTVGLSELAHPGLFGGKSKAQSSRDTSRAATQSSGLADKNFNVTLADGSLYNIGADGHASLNNVGKNIDGGTTRHPYDVDFSNPLAKNAVGSLNDLARQILGEGASQTQIEQEIGMLDNAVTSNAKTQDDVTKNISAISAKYNSPQSGGASLSNLPPSSLTSDNGGAAAAQAALASMSNNISQANAAQSAAAKKAKLLSYANPRIINNPTSTDYSGLLKNKYA